MKNVTDFKIFLDKKNINKVFRYVLNITLVILALNFLSNNFVMVNTALMHISSIYLLLVVLIFNLPIKKFYNNLKEKHIGKNSLYKILIGIFLIIFSFILLISTTIVFLNLASVLIFTSGLGLIFKGIEIIRKEFYFLSIFVLFYVILFVFIQTITFFWHLIQSFSLMVSSSVGLLIGKSMFLGPTISGFWIVIIFLLLPFISFILSSNKKQQLNNFLFTIAGIFISWIIYLIIIGFIEFESKYDVANLHIILFILCLIPTIINFLKSNIDGIKVSNQNISKIKIKKIVKNQVVWGLIFLFFSTLILTSFFGLENNKSNEKIKIMFYGQNMLGSWDIPEYGKYGREASGMFGLLPIYLDASGFESTILVDNITSFIDTTQPVYENITRYVNLTDYVKIVESNEVTSDLLQDVDIFVVININKSFFANEKKVIWEFVDNGGSLLVLGDHTNVGGIQEPLNDLLKPVEISFRFDSALPLDSKFNWLTCYEFVHHPITYKIKNFDEIQISVGASLNTSVNSIPLIIGRYSLSDAGDPFNEDISYLGDYEYNRGEQLGDLILGAATFYGDGKVIVFGDTSTFQNSAIPYSYSFIHNIFIWLNTKQTAITVLLQIGISILLLFIAFCLLSINKKIYIPHTIFTVVLTLALIISALINSVDVTDMQISGDVVYIDSSHNEKFNLEPFTEKSVNGLILNLNRNGYTPIILREFSKEKIEKSKILIFNAPTQSITKDEVEFLHKYMIAGGIIILAVGYPNKEAVSILLEKYSLNILNVPLGPFPYVEDNPQEFENEPRFVDSWPIIFNENIGRSYYNFTWDKDYNLMVFIKQGKGGLLLISDNQYLLDKNIESIYDYWPGNIILLKNIIDEFQAFEE